MTNSQTGLPTTTTIFGPAADSHHRPSSHQQQDISMTDLQQLQTEPPINDINLPVNGALDDGNSSEGSNDTNDNNNTVVRNSGNVVTAAAAPATANDSIAATGDIAMEVTNESQSTRRLSESRIEATEGGEGVVDDEDDAIMRQGKIVEKSPKGRYMRFNERLGEGAFKRVYRAYDSNTGVEVAWNTVKLSALKGEGGKRILTEMKILQSLNHPNIIRFYGSWVTRETQSVVFITELISGGTLRDFMMARPTKLRILKRWCRNLLDALDYLHGMTPPIIHRDLKCDNVFINLASGDLRLGDLGLASWERNGDAKSVLGTPEYMAPELYDEQYDEKVDIYAFGLCVLEMITKLTPYRECSTALQIMRRVTSNIPPLAFTDLKDGPHKDFIGKCILPPKEGSRRPSCKELMMESFLKEDPLPAEGQDDDSNIDCLNLLKPESELWQYIEVAGNKQRSFDVPVAAVATAAIARGKTLRAKVPETITEEDEDEHEDHTDCGAIPEMNNAHTEPVATSATTQSLVVDTTTATIMNTRPSTQSVPGLPSPDFETKSDQSTTIFANGVNETVSKHGKIPSSGSSSMAPPGNVELAASIAQNPSSPSSMTYEPTVLLRSDSGTSGVLPAPPTSHYSPDQVPNDTCSRSDDQVRDQSPSAQENEVSPSIQVNEVSPSIQVNEVSPSVQVNEVPPSVQVNEVPPSVQVNEVPPSVQVNEVPPSVQVNEVPPSVQVNEVLPSEPVHGLQVSDVPAQCLERRQSNSSTEEECTNGWSIKARKTENKDILNVTLARNHDGERTKVRFEFNIVTESPHNTAAELVKDLELPINEIAAIEGELSKFCERFRWIGDSELTHSHCLDDNDSSSNNEQDDATLMPPPLLVREQSSQSITQPVRSVSPSSICSAPSKTIAAQPTTGDLTPSRISRRSTEPNFVQSSTEGECVQGSTAAAGASENSCTNLSEGHTDSAVKVPQAGPEFESDRDWDEFIAAEELKAKKAVTALQKSIEAFKLKRDSLQAQQNEVSKRFQLGVGVAHAAAAVARSISRIVAEDAAPVNDARRIRRGSSKMSLVGKEEEEPKTKEQLRQEAKEKSEAEKIARKKQSKEEARNLEAQLFTEFAEDNHSTQIPGTNAGTPKMGSSGIMSFKDNSAAPNVQSHLQQPQNSTNMINGNAPALSQASSFSQQSNSSNCISMANIAGNSSGLAPPPSNGPPVMVSHMVAGVSGQQASGMYNAPLHTSGQFNGVQSMLMQQQQPNHMNHQHVTGMNGVAQQHGIPMPQMQAVPNGTGSQSTLMFSTSQ